MRAPWEWGNACATQCFSENDSTSAPPLDTRFLSRLWTPSVFSDCFLQPFSWIQFHGVGVVGFSCGWRAWAWSIISRALMCVIVTATGAYCLGAGQRTDTHKHSNSHKDADRRAHSLIILGPSCEEGLLIWSNATWKIAPSQHTVLKQRHPHSSCSHLQRVWKELPV